MLRRHGIHGMAAHAVHRLSAELLTMTREADRESAGAVDVESGAALPDILAGGQDDVDLSAHLTAMLPSRRYVQIHTHAGDSSFSDDDVAILLSRSELTAMIVLGRGGTAYVVSKTMFRQRTPHLTAMVEWNRVFSATIERFRAMARSGDLTERDARATHTHAVMRTISRRFHLRYSRIMGAL